MDHWVTKYSKRRLTHIATSMPILITIRLRKWEFFNALFTRELRILEKEHVDEEIKYLKNVFLSIGYKLRDINKTIIKAKSMAISRSPSCSSQTLNEKVYLPYIQGVTDKLVRVIRKKEISTLFRPLDTIQ